MKIAVCIPVYNFDVRALITALREQADNCAAEIEIISIDDASDDSFKVLNKKVKGLCANYPELPQNIGRAAIRNLFLNYTNADFLLFLDCDVSITAGFLQKYLDFLSENHPAQVVYGGRCVTEGRTAQNSLRWDFAAQRENLTAEQRQKNPGRSFQSNNFVIQREILAQFPFDEDISGYGYEDVIFGLTLESKGIKIYHLENAVISGPLEPNKVFLKKSREAARGAAVLLINGNNFSRELRLVKAYILLKKMGVLKLLKWGFSASRLENKLLRNPTLFSFDIYRLFLFSDEMNRKK